MTDEDRESFRRINETLKRLQASAPRNRMPDPLPMHLAPLDGTPIWVCGVPHFEVAQPGDEPVWIVACRAGSAWYAQTTDQYSMWIEDPFGWLPCPPVLTGPVRAAG